MRRRRGEGDERSANLSQLAGQTLEVPVPVHGHEVCSAICPLVCAVCEEFLQPGEPTRTSRDCWSAGLHAEFAQRLDLLDPRCGRCLGGYVTSSICGRPIWFVEGEDVCDVRTALNKRGDLINERVVGEAPEHWDEFERGLGFGGRVDRGRFRTIVVVPCQITARGDPDLVVRRIARIGDEDEAALSGALKGSLGKGGGEA